MNPDQNYPLPQVFLVDGGQGPQYPAHQPNLVPCWSFPPPQERQRRSRERSGGCMGVRPGTALLVLMLFLLVFAALGFEGFQIYRMQRELKELRQAKPEREAPSTQKQIGFPEAVRKEEESRAAAHVIGRMDGSTVQPLRWNPHDGRGFTSGGVAYIYEDGALQVNETGLYHVYSRVELTFRDCSPESAFLHSVYVRRTGRTAPLKLMEAHRAGFCPQRTRLSWTTESYLGSALQLQKLDRVYVNVSQPGFLRHGSYANFFGLYKI
ncbi:tumor necrosis factor ligand superfamily member 6 [Notolabrus celidotus]|uniref:tumor necrosis factor ligand superfamily member 6 n=1 Tax=Notolabrus celidotus TaxID=1203425 RepID=UPI00148FFDE8|nr:tumor necrosis factor ligand superfamily member 6 [Notolabrus celidotus]